MDTPITTTEVDKRGRSLTWVTRWQLMLRNKCVRFIGDDRINERRRWRAHVAELCHRLIVPTALTVPVAVMSMVPACAVRYWQWLALTLASPVVCHYDVMS